MGLFSGLEGHFRGQNRTSKESSAGQSQQTLQPLLHPTSFGKDFRLDLLIFDYEEARKPSKAEAPAEFAEKYRNKFHHRDTEDTEKCKEERKDPERRS